jgi:hypothetical protein
MVHGGSVVRRLIIPLTALLAAPAFVIQPASAVVLFSCTSVTGSAVLSPGLVHDKRPQSLSSGPTAPGGPAAVTLVSTNDAGVKANGHNQSVSMSADGSRVAFPSYATNLDPADTDSSYDVYVKDLNTGDVTLASTSDAGVKGDDPSFWPSLSADGTRVAFISAARNLDPADTDFGWDVYVKDLVTGDLMFASSSDAGVNSNGQVWMLNQPPLSADGTRVAFASTATNLDPADTNSLNDVYVKNLNTGNIDLVSRSDTGVKGNGHSIIDGSISPDGRRVAFISNATNLDPADTDNLRDVYVKDRHSGDIVMASTSDAGIKGNEANASPLLSADGTKVAFFSVANNLDPADTDIQADVYVKDLANGDITLASTSDTGVKGNDHSFVSSLSADATKVAFFSYATNLDPADSEGTVADVYVKDLVSGDTTLASTSDTGVKSENDSRGAELSADGMKLAFRSDAINFDPADTDGETDIYVKDLPTVPTSLNLAGCSNGNSGTASVVDIRSYGARPLGCPVSLGGAAGNDYADTTPILVGGTLSMTIDWATGPNSYGVAAAKAGPTGTEWRFRLAITASPGHDTPATNQYLPAAGSGFTKTRLQGKFDISALDSFNCATGTADPLSWLSLANNGAWVAKTS